MLYFTLVIFALGTFVASLIATFVVKRIATRLKLVDKPDHVRKLHGRVVPMGGGVALWFTFWVVVGFIVLYRPVYGIDLLAGKLFAAFVGSTLLVLLGLVDDKRNLGPGIRLALTALIALFTIVSGLVVDKITNPSGGVIALGSLAGAVSFLWLMGIMYTTKIVDGLDGLATGIVTVGSLIIVGLTLTTRFYQPNVALLSAIFAATCLGFLVFNFSPASIFLGESGSLFVGFMLGVLSIIAGSKIATAFLVLAVPILDLARVIWLRLKNKQSVFQGDRRHLHYALLDYGWNERQVVMLYYIIAAVFGGLALYLASWGKLVLLVFLGIIGLSIGAKLPSVRR